MIYHISPRHALYTRVHIVYISQIYVKVKVHYRFRQMIMLVSSWLSMLVATLATMTVAETRYSKKIFHEFQSSTSLKSGVMPTGVFHINDNCTAFKQTIRNWCYAQPRSYFLTSFFLSSAAVVLMHIPVYIIAPLICWNYYLKQKIFCTEFPFSLFQSHNPRSNGLCFDAYIYMFLSNCFTCFDMGMRINQYAVHPLPQLELVLIHQIHLIVHQYQIQNVCIVTKILWIYILILTYTYFYVDWSTLYFHLPPMRSSLFLIRHSIVSVNMLITVLTNVFLILHIYAAWLACYVTLMVINVSCSYWMEIKYVNRVLVLRFSR